MFGARDVSLQRLQRLQSQVATRAGAAALLGVDKAAATETQTAEAGK